MVVLCPCNALINNFVQFAIGLSQTLSFWLRQKTKTVSNKKLLFELNQRAHPSFPLERQDTAGRLRPFLEVRKSSKQLCWCQSQSVSSCLPKERFALVFLLTLFALRNSLCDTGLHIRSRQNQRIHSSNGIGVFFVVINERENIAHGV